MSSAANTTAARPAGRLHWLHPIPAVPSTGTIRRLQALRANGHHPHAVGQWTGLHVDFVSMLTAGQCETVQMDAAMAVASVYLKHADEVADMDVRLTSRIARLGWVAAAAWFGLDIDDPAERPLMDSMTSMTVQRALCAPDESPSMARRVAERLRGDVRTRELTLWERGHVARHLLLQGVTRNRTNMVSGLAPKTIHAMWAYLCG